MKTSITSLLGLVLLATGCVGGGMPPGSGRTAHGPTNQHRYGQQELNWEQKLVRGLNPFQSSTQAAPTPPKKYDPLDLKNGYGKQSPEVYLSMAQMAEGGGNAPHARQMYGKALSLSPGHVDALLGLAHLEDRQGNLDEAMRIYTQAVALHPTNATALNDLALCQARRGDLQQSAYMLQQATQLAPDKALYRNNLAKVLAESGRSEDALAELSTVHPPAAARYNLAHMLQERGRVDEAVAYLKSALSIDPNLVPASDLLAQLEAITSEVAGGPELDHSILPTPQTPAETTEGVFPNTGQQSPLTGPIIVPGVASQTTLGNPPSTLPPLQ